MRATVFSGAVPFIFCHATIIAIVNAAPNSGIDHEEGNERGQTGALRGAATFGGASPGSQRSIDQILSTPTLARTQGRAGEARAGDADEVLEPDILGSFSACFLMVDEDIYYDPNGDAISVIPLNRGLFESGAFIQDSVLASCSEEAIEKGTCFEISAERNHAICELCQFSNAVDESLHIVPCRQDVINIAMKCFDGPCIENGPDPKELDAALMEKRKEERNLLFADDMLDTQKSRWMTSLHNKGLMEGITLKDMVLPGSHNSAAVSLDANKHCGRVNLGLDRLANEVAQNQDIHLNQQIDRGIRFLDLRVIENKHFEGRMYPLHHSYLIDEKYINTLYGALDFIQLFLQNNPLEMLVVRIDAYSGCKDGDHKAIWKAEIDRRPQLELMTKEHLSMEMSELAGLALIDLGRSVVSEDWPGTGFGANMLDDNKGPFVYGSYYMNKVGDANMFTVWDFYPNIDEIDVGQTLANFFFDGLAEWDKPYTKHMWMMHSLVGLRAMNVNAIMADRVGQTDVYSVATQLTLYRIIEKNFPSKWDAVHTQNFVNAHDEEFEHHCPSHYVLQGFESYHDNGAEDRKWKFVCRRVGWLDADSYTSSGSSSWEKRQYHPSTFRTDFDKGGGAANDFDRDVNFHWADGRFAITGVGGKHSNRHQDRKFYFYASAVTKMPSSCGWTGFVNALDGPMNYQTDKDEWVSGVISQHTNYNEDRRWKFYVCR